MERQAPTTTVDNDEPLQEAVRGRVREEDEDAHAKVSLIRETEDCSPFYLFACQSRRGTKSPEGPGSGRDPRSPTPTSVLPSQAVFGVYV